MSEPAFWTFARRPVALALAGVVGLTAFNQLLGSRLEAAAPMSLVSLSGRAVAVDGDTLDLDGKRVRLEGIDAPEMGQTCGRRWIGTWNCGRAAQKALNGLVDGRRIECQSKGQDKYGRELGICFVDGRDINAELVRQGMAWAFVKFSQSYIGQEAAARKDKTGIWQGTARSPVDLPRAEVADGRNHCAQEAAPSRATSPPTAGSTTCPGATGIRRSRSNPTRANAGSAPKPKPPKPAGARRSRIDEVC